MISGWDNHIKNFLKQAQKHQVKMILVGGGAVYFHGYQRHSEVIMEEPVLRWRVISYEDLIDSKIKAGRPKDLLDIQELQRIRKK